MFTLAKDLDLNPAVGVFRWRGMIRVLAGFREEGGMDEEETGPGY